MPLPDKGIASHQALEAFPNPAFHTVTIKLTGFEKCASLIIYDHLGRVVLMGQLAKGQNKVIRDLTRGLFKIGIYFLSASFEGQSGSGRLAVMK